jgi:hypothetical protein
MKRKVLQSCRFASLSRTFTIVHLALNVEFSLTQRRAAFGDKVQRLRTHVSKATPMSTTPTASQQISFGCQPDDLTLILTRVIGFRESFRKTCE